jgi:hypothetical protein
MRLLEEPVEDGRAADEASRLAARARVDSWWADAIGMKGRLGWSASASWLG